MTGGPALGCTSRLGVKVLWVWRAPVRAGPMGKPRSGGRSGLAPPREGQQGCSPLAPWAGVVGVTGKQQTQWKAQGQVARSPWQGRDRWSRTNSKKFTETMAPDAAPVS